MGVDPSLITINLNKLLLFNTGASIQSHQYYHNNNEEFGTLFIQLPSIYDGGSAAVKFQGNISALLVNNCCDRKYKKI